MKRITLSLLFLIAACGSSSTSDDTQTLDAIDTAYPDGLLESADDNPPMTTGVLRFVDETDDAGKPTAGATTFTVMLNYSGTRDLKVRYTEGGNPVQGIAIIWEMIDPDNKELCSLSGQVTYTGEDGIATNKLSAVKQEIGQFKVKVCVDGKPDVACLYFDVSLTPKGIVPLIVGFAEYKGQYAMLDQAEIRLFKQGANGKPSCADLPLNALPKADAVSPTISITGSYSFITLPNLENEGTQTYSILALASAGKGPTLATACNDKDGVVTFGKSRYVELVLSDLSPRIAASYDITSTFDLVSGLPPAVSQVIYVITNFFDNPAAELMVLLCTAVGNNATVKDFCGYIFQDPEHPSVDKLNTTADVILQIVNAILIDLLKSNCPGQDPELCTKLWYTGKDVSDILTRFQLLATLTFSKEPDETGHMDASSCKDVWHSARLRWTLGSNCPPDDENCGWQKFSFSAIPGIEDAISGSFDATFKDGKLTIAMHSLKLKYGALIDFTLEKWILPKLFGDGSDGLPAVDSFETMLQALLAGRACLQDASCCTTFAENVSGSTTGVTKTAVKSACDALVSAGAKYLRDQLNALDTTPDSFKIGTKSPCATYDTNKDMKVDALGTKEAQCEWDTRLKVSTTEYTPTGTFYGKLK